MKPFGKELVLDLHDCYEARFNRADLRRYFNELCDLINMEQCKLTWWDYFWWPGFIIRLMKWDKKKRLFGTSAVQFIKTSNITIHIIDNMRHVYINVFSCKGFDEKMVADYTQCYFWGEIVNQTILERK